MKTKTYPAHFVTFINTALVAVYESENVYGNNPIEYRPGICASVRNQADVHTSGFVIDETRLWLNTAMARWPDYSGNYEYPVPAPARYVCRKWTALPPEEDAFYALPKWDTTTEYGRSRWSLLAFLLEEASKMKVQ